MAPKKLRGWIFDAYPEPEGMSLWVITRGGAHHHLFDPWRPRFYVGEPFSRALPLLQNRPFPVDVQTTERMEVFSGKTIPVLEVFVPPLRYQGLTNEIQNKKILLFDGDVHLVQSYHYDRGHFPLALCEFELEDGRVTAWSLKDDPWALDYDLPPLRTVHLALTGSETTGRVDPNHAVRGKLSLAYEGTVHEFEGSDEDQLESLARRLQEWDPDVITSEWGDSHILPRLTLLSQRHKIPLPFSRDPAKSMAGRGNRSFFTYGRTVYQSGVRYLFGRWHLDVENSFHLKESGTDGLYEIARIAKIPVQRAARSTIGTSLTSMQLAKAREKGILIPMDKQQMEEFRSGENLVTADKGGLVYEPEIGWYENVAEYDFASMYPNLMVKHNISPETVNCPCCPHNKVPEIGHHLCERRRGIVPMVLEPILKKRAQYKALMKAGAADARSYKERASAFKWVLVCCFGYLGFRNARFGKIESHECVTTWGREVLLQAKETVEALGFHLLHANVDAVYVQAKKETDYESIRQAIEKATAMPVALEGVYKWIRFCPSRMDKQSGVPNKYFGAFTNGETKIRGIALRRRDTPRLFKKMQMDMIDRLARAQDLAGVQSAAAELKEIVEETRSRLQEGRVTAQDLAITFHLSKNPEDYVHDTLSALASKKLQASGVPLHPGETVQYVIVSNGDKVKDWRVAPLPMVEVLEYDEGKYLELLEKNSNEIFS